MVQPVSFTSAGRPIFSLADDGTFVYPPAPLIAAPSPSRWLEKADAFAAGWMKDVGQIPLLPATALGLAQAQHETLCGDAWPGEHNWGAVQKRKPTVVELAALKGISPSPSSVAQARTALAAAVAQGTVPLPVEAALHVDSSPLLPPPHWYWMFFWAFATDALGAELFVKEIAVNRPSCRAVLTAATGSWQTDCESFSTTLYATHYYEGVHDPTTALGRQKNIDAYAASMFALVPGIAQALSTWDPRTPTGDVETDTADKAS